MAKLEAEHIFQGTVHEVFQGIRHYEGYPNELPGVTKVSLLPPKLPGSRCQVLYELNLIKSFHYTLNMFEESPERIWWDLAESNLFKRSEGSWHLEPKGKTKTVARYTIDVQFRGLVPSMITDKVAQANLPAMFAGFQRLVDQVKASR